MGTNAYWVPKPCESCGRGDEELHIGKSSAGWCYSLHVHPERGIHDLPDWERLWAQPGSVIRDEYREVISAEEMRRWITERGTHGQLAPLTDHWLRQNDAIVGPNNLARHRIDQHCIGHGAGTYDLIIGGEDSW
jgi:hypothetical protein